MRAIALTAALVMAVLSCSSQTKPTYQTGTIVDVKDHQPVATSDDQAKQYDVSVKVGDTIYVILFTSPDGSDTVKYRVGIDGPVLIEGDTMKFSDMMGNTRSLPITSRAPAPPKKKS